MKKIDPADLIEMKSNTYRVELAYARDDNILFGERIYRKDASLWLYRDLARVVEEAAQYCQAKYGLRFVLYDGLRPYDAQEKMVKTARVQNNPHWLKEPRLLSSPGGGAHPRGMAIDIGLETPDGVLVDMGCPFDYLADNPHPDHNPAHRDYRHPVAVLNNRNMLDHSMLKGAKAHNTPLTLLAEEWWDFRLPHSFYGSYLPLHEDDLDEQIRLL